MKEPIEKRPGRPRSLKSHQAILRSTIDLLAEVGFDSMSIDAIAARAKVGKTTIYRRYNSKEELVVDAIESVREEVIIPNTDSFWGDIEALIESAAEITLSSLGRQTVAMIIGTASSNPQFARIYWNKYLQPRRKAFAVVIDRAKTRGEIKPDLESDLVFDLMSGIMLYALVFQPAESWKLYVRRALAFVLKDKEI